VNRLLWLGLGAGFPGVLLLPLSFTYVAGGGRRDRRRCGIARDAHVTSAAGFAVAPPNGFALLPRSRGFISRRRVKNVISASSRLPEFCFSPWPPRARQPVRRRRLAVTIRWRSSSPGRFSSFMLVIITFYAGELVWRERDNASTRSTTRCRLQHGCRSSQGRRADAHSFAAAGDVLVCGVAIQTFKGYTHYELACMRATMFGIDLVSYWLICVLAITVIRSSTRNMPVIS